MSMQTVNFTYDPIFIVQRITEIIHENSKHIKLVPFNELFYKLTREQYDLLFDDYLEYIKYEQEELTITKEFLTGFHEYLLKLMEQDIALYNAKHSEYYVYDKASNTYYTHQFGEHTIVLTSILRDHFKSTDGLTQENLKEYIDSNFKLKGANYEEATKQDVSSYMLKYSDYYVSGKLNYRKYTIKEDKLFANYLAKLEEKSKMEGKD